MIGSGHSKTYYTRRVLLGDEPKKLAVEMTKREDEALDSNFALHGGWRHNKDKEIIIPNFKNYKDI